ncbi:hypothetical protein WICPIJ_008355 [Wickerhamomyces pijperi]|uniref:Uncharacterized protein n=1 Tax=Wickerhamomyces pijperi TaxID=599730 RepID=A0A9P8TIM5_WICPI|nr:hypothetical protein WICPIJ_008355 [Wickerhamomyces pijperi]
MSSYKPQSGTVHEYTPRLQAFELTPTNQSITPSNAIVFIGGLTDGLLTVPYITELNKHLPSQWSIFQIIFSSSYIGWGTGSLDRDVKEVGLLVTYLKEKLGKEKVIIMGHSTGCQDSIHYALKQFTDIKAVNGIILQAPVSDREAITDRTSIEELTELNREVKEIYESQGKDRVLPKKFSDIFFGAPISAYRWLSLADHNGDDDYFSTDLPDERLASTFGSLNGLKLLVLYSGSDEFAKKGGDKNALIKRWEEFTSAEVWSKQSKVVKNGTHNLMGCGEEPVNIMVESVVNFIQTDIEN